jgi:hypothetical protein
MVIAVLANLWVHEWICPKMIVSLSYQKEATTTISAMHKMQQIACCHENDKRKDEAILHYPDMIPAISQDYVWDKSIRKRYPNAVMVGWIDEYHDFPTGVVSDDLLDRLFNHCLCSINHSKGMHFCGFCMKENIDEVNVESVGVILRNQTAYRNNLRMQMGNGEILVIGANDDVYIAPTLIYHYIVVHGYLPPRQFLDALHTSDARAGERLEQKTWSELGAVYLEAWENARRQLKIFQENISEGSK